MSWSLRKCLILMVASVVKSPTMIRVTLLCGWVLSERALWRLLVIQELNPNPAGIPTDCILNATQAPLNPTKFHYVSLELPEIPLNLPNSLEFRPNPCNSKEIKTGEEYTQSARWKEVFFGKNGFSSKGLPLSSKCLHPSLLFLGSNFGRLEVQFHFQSLAELILQSWSQLL